jgi:hypothetical protein
MTYREDAEALYTRANALQRELEQVREQLERLRPDEDRWEPETPVPGRDATPPPWLTDHRRRVSLLDDARKLVGDLDDPTLALVVPILEQLVQSSELRPEVLAELRSIVERISRSAWTR